MTPLQDLLPLPPAHTSAALPTLPCQVDHWVLIDAGQADTLLFGGHASSLVRAIKRALAPARRGAPPGRLDAIVLTHAHAVGALHKLLHAYPDAVVRVGGDWLNNTCLL